MCNLLIVHLRENNHHWKLIQPNEPSSTVPHNTNCNNNFTFGSQWYHIFTSNVLDKVLRNYIQNHKFVSLDQIYFYKTKQISCTTRKSNNLRLITRTYQNPIDREQYSLKRTSPLKYEYCGNFYVTILFLLQ